MDAGNSTMCARRELLPGIFAPSRRTKDARNVFVPRKWGGAAQFADTFATRALFSKEKVM